MQWMQPHSTKTAKQPKRQVGRGDKEQDKTTKDKTYHPTKETEQILRFCAHENWSRPARRSLVEQDWMAQITVQWRY